MAWRGRKIMSFSKSILLFREMIDLPLPLLAYRTGFSETAILEMELEVGGKPIELEYLAALAWTLDISLHMLCYFLEQCEHKMTKEKFRLYTHTFSITEPQIDEYINKLNLARKNEEKKS